MGGGYRPVTHNFRKLFSCTFPLQVVCLCLEHFINILASKLIILGQFQNSIYLASWERLHQTTPQISSQATFALQIVCLYLQLLKSFKVDDARKIQHIWPYGGALGHYHPMAHILERSRRADIKL